jgi:hypothetical protein
MPEVRMLSCHRETIGEMCECYSIAVLFLRDLQAKASCSEQIDAYEELVVGIEQKVSSYLTGFVRLSA